jgi:hypothetical protein
MVRSFVATAHVESEETTPAGGTSYRLVGATPYDGAIVVQSERVERVPRALVALEWREYGPFAYHLGWRPHDPYELHVEEPSGVHVIARARMRAMLARLALLLQSRAQGVFVDDGAFVATVADVERRTEGDVTVRRSTSRPPARGSDPDPRLSTGDVYRRGRHGPHLHVHRGNGPQCLSGRPLPGATRHWLRSARSCGSW